MSSKMTAAPRALLIAACAAATPSFAFADEPPVPPSMGDEAFDQDRAFTLDPVVVTARRQAATVAVDEAAERLRQRAGATSLVTAADYEDGRATTVSDIMNFAPGVYAQTRHGEETRFSIRGSGIQRGFLMRGIQLYQDGVPLNLADGGGDYQAIDPLALQHVEVWRGANALEYGSSTLGGAVNFVTPTGRTAGPARLRLDAGSFGQRRAHAMFAGAGETLDGMVSVTRSEQDGWRDHSATEATRLSANLGYRFSDTLEARLYLGHVESDLQLPGSLTGAAMTADRRQAAPNSAAANAGNYYTSDRAAVRVAWAPSDRSSVTASVWISERDRFHPMVHGILDQDQKDTGADVRGAFDLADGALIRRLVVGVSAGRYDGREDRFANAAGQRGARTGETRVEADLLTAYAEYSHGLTPELTLQLGAQATRATRRLDNLMTPSGSIDVAFNGFSPKLGLIWKTAPTDQLFANVSRSFEPAPFGEAAVRPLLPMPNAQEATTFELGWRRNAGPVALEAVAYHARIDGELLALTDATGVSIGTANADRTIHQGLELGASLPLSEAIRVRATYLWNDFRFDGDANYGDNRIAGIAPHLLHAELEWDVTPWLSVAPMLEWQPGSTWIDHANTLKQSGQTLVHLRLHGDVSRSVGWFVDVRNITDRDYVASTAVQANARGLDGAYYFPGDPRSVYAGLQWRY